MKLAAVVILVFPGVVSWGQSSTAEHCIIRLLVFQLCCKKKKKKILAVSSISKLFCNLNKIFGLSFKIQVCYSTDLFIYLF